jgi:hypothetical protein
MISNFLRTTCNINLVATGAWVPNSLRHSKIKLFSSLLCIRIGFNEDLDPGSQTNADPEGSGSWSGHQKFNFYMKNILKVGNRSKT